MKILCPIDFSKNSVNAAEWATKFIHEMGGGELHLVNCVNTQMRADMFTKMDSLFAEKSRDDIQKLAGTLTSMSEKVTVSHQVVISDPKSYIVNLSQEKTYDFIITGTKGLTALKDMTVGSVTEYIINHSGTPLMAIPGEAHYTGLSSIMLGVDDKLIEDNRIIKPLLEIARKLDSRLHMVHVRQKGDSVFEYDPAMDIYLEGMDYDYKALEYESSVSKTLDEYSDYINADALCMIHRKKNWLQKLFVRSTTKSELFNLHKPLIVLIEN